MAENAAGVPQKSTGSAEAQEPWVDITDIFAIENLFSIPLKAVIDANAYAARLALDLVIRFGFNPMLDGCPDGDRHLGTMRMAKFVFYTTDDQGRRIWNEISIPMLSLIPIPMLEVRNAQFEFAVRILIQESLFRESLYRGSESPGSLALAEGRRLLTVMAPLDTTGNKAIRSTTNQSLDANMAVKFTVEKADLPAGIMQLLNLGQEGIRSRPEAAVEIQVSPERFLFTAGIEHRLTIEVGRRGEPGVEWVPLPGREVGITVSICWGPDAETLFTRPIGVLLGDLVGAPGRTGVVVRADLQGKVEVQFFPQTNPGNPAPDWNGFVIVRVATATERNIQFSFKA